MWKMIFLGNPLWGDDGVGQYLLHRFTQLQKERSRLRRGGKDVVLIDGGTGGLNLLNHLDGADMVEIFDAIQSGGRPGDVYRIPARELKYWPARSSHDFGIEQVLQLHFETSANPLDPERIIFYGIEIARIEFGCDLSPEVRKACDTLFELIKKEFDA
jgi:hydrogenase maturation protease